MYKNINLLIHLHEISLNLNLINYILIYFIWFDKKYNIYVPTLYI